MKLLLWFFLLLVCVLIVSVVVGGDAGYSVISFHHWVITSSLSTTLACLLLGFIVFYLFLRIIVNIFSLPKRLARRKKLTRALRYRVYMEKGVIGLAAGDFKRAEKYFLKANSLEEASCINYLLAAQAAQAQQHYLQRDQYFQKAFDIAGDDRFAVLLTEAHYRLQADQADEALLIFKQLFRQQPHNPLVLRGLKNIYFQMHAWESLKLILPQLKKQKLISADEMSQLS